MSKRRSHIVALAAVFALTGISAIGAQQRTDRTSDQQIGDPLRRIDGRIATFRTSFDRAIDRSRINGSRSEDDINQAVSDFKQATERLRDRVQDRRAGAADVEDVLRSASVVDGVMANHTLDVTATRDWQSLRSDLDELARAYGLTRNGTGSQGVQSRFDDEQVKQLLTRTKKNADQFRRSLDRALDRSRIDRSREEDNINQFVIDFAEATDHLRDHFDRRQAVPNDVEDVLRHGVSIDSFMQRHQLVGPAENDWLTVRRDLDELARAYNVVWNWSTPRDTALERSDGLDDRLTGTYQLERSRGEDPARAVEQATRVLPSAQRQGVAQRLMNRLNAPDTIAIDRNANSVTIASSRGQRITFKADGQARTERGDAGRTVTTRAVLYGDQLMMTTTGTGGSDFAVTFEPRDDGRSLRVTRRIYDDSLRQPVTVQSFYRRSSDQAEWDVYSPTRSARTQTDSGAGDFGACPLAPGW